MNILVVGAKGNFGSAVTGYFIENNHVVKGIGRGDPLPADPGLFDACILAIPVTEVEAYIASLRGCPIIEISSVKSEVLKFRDRIISIHPMFGPRSILSNDLRDIIFISDISPLGSRKLIEGLFPGFKITVMTADQHDRIMADLLVKPYIFSLLAASIGVEEHDVSCSSFRVLKNLIEISDSESDRVLRDTIRLNPHARRILDNLIDETGRLVNLLGSTGRLLITDDSEGGKGGQI